jgi:hypothetical protein
MTTQEQYRFGYFAITTSVFVMTMAVPKTNLWSVAFNDGFTFSCYMNWTLLIAVYCFSLCSFYLVQGTDPGYIHQGTDLGGIYICQKVVTQDSHEGKTVRIYMHIHRCMYIYTHM